MATEKRQFTLRLNSEIHDKIKVVAEVHKRSITMEIEHILELYLHKYEKEEGIIHLKKDTP